ncbi:MAG: serine hydrolase [Gemmatimonadota bacterium]
MRVRERTTKTRGRGRLAACLALAAALAASACGRDAPTGSEAESGAAGDVERYGAGIAAEIARIESGLLPPVPVEGTSGWTLAERMDRWNVEAISVAVIHDGEVRWAKAWGLADREEGVPATTETLFQAGSISKPVAATGALRLVEEGVLALDEPISTFLTSWTLPENDLTRQAPVTLRRLLSHTAGTTVHGFPGYAPWAAVPTVPQVLDGAPPANTAPVRVDIPPGSEVRYSGGGTTIAQLAMTDATGEAFPVLLRRLVLEPAGMKRSTYENPLPESRLPEAAAGYRRSGMAVPGKRHTYPEMAAAGLWTTPTDLARFAIALQRSLQGEPGGVLQPETAREMLTPVMGAAGLGFFLRDEGGATYFEHGGADEGFQAIFLASRDGRYGAVTMANSDNGNALGEELVRAIAREHGWEGYLAEPVTPVAMSAEELARYAGRFAMGPDQVATLTVGEGALDAAVTLSDTSRMLPLGDDVFLYEARGWRFRILPGEDGGRAIEAVAAPFQATFPRIEGEAPTPVELLDAGRTAEAIAALEKAGAAEAHVNSLGYALLNAGRAEEAVDVLAWNAERYPSHANPWDSLADAYVAAGDTAGAARAFRKVLEAIPLDTEADPAALESLEQRARAGLETLGAG